MVIGAFEPRFVSERVIEVHRTAAGYRKAIRNTVFYEKIRHVVSKSDLHNSSEIKVFKKVPLRTKAE
jgi:hypothetical protein